MYAPPSKPYFTLEDPVIPMYHPRVLFQTAVAQGAPAERLLSGTGLSREVLDNPRARMTYSQFGTLSDNALQLTGNEALGLDFGQNIHLTNMGMFGLAVAASSTGQEALDTMLTYGPVVAPGFAFSQRNDGENLVIAMRPTLPMGTMHRFAIESTVACLAGVASFLLRGHQAGAFPRPQFSLRLDYPAPAHTERYASQLSSRVKFDQPVTEFIFSRAALGLKLDFGDPLTASEARRLCDFELSQLPGTGLLEQVRALLTQTPGEYLSLLELSRALGTSARSLRRALSRLGSSYQTLLFEVRREHALDFIRSPHLSVESLAQKLGFSDARAFRRAFKRWTGVTPSEYRQERQQALEAAAQKPDNTAELDSFEGEAEERSQVSAIDPNMPVVLEPPPPSINMDAAIA